MDGRAGGRTYLYSACKFKRVTKRLCHLEMSCRTILGVKMQAVEMDAQRHQHTQANLDGLR